jgi:hypothetical protein
VLHIDPDQPIGVPVDSGLDLLGRELAAGVAFEGSERGLAVAPSAHDGAEPAGAELLVRGLNGTGLQSGDGCRREMNPGHAREVASDLNRQQRTVFSDRLTPHETEPPRAEGWL